MRTENGHDVVYVGASNQFSTNTELYRYELTDINNPTLDQMTKVGAYLRRRLRGHHLRVRPGAQALRPHRQQLDPVPVLGPHRAGADERRPDGADQREHRRFQSWLTAQTFDIQKCGMEFDPVRRTFPIWCGGGVTWELSPPAGGNSIAGWSIAQHAAPGGTVPSTSVQAIEVLGKWKYAPYYDTFVGLEDRSTATSGSTSRWAGCNPTCRATRCPA